MGVLRRKKTQPEEVIDLRERQPLPLHWGSPVPCPTCRGRGYLDHIDPFREVMYLHCTECFAKYEVTKASLSSGSSDDTVPA